MSTDPTILPRLFGPAVTACTVMGLVSCALAAPYASFSGMSKTGTVVITFESQGCFHNTNHTIELKGTPTSTAKITEVKYQWNDTAKKRARVGQKVLGEIPLSAQDIKGLEALLEFYRKGAPGGCTTIDQITINVMKDGKTLSTEKFSDASCATHEMKGVTIFPELINRLAKKP